MIFIAGFILTTAGVLLILQQWEAVTLLFKGTIGAVLTVLGDKEKQCRNEDRKGRDPEVSKSTDEFHQECKVPGPLLLNFFGHKKIKA